MSESHREIKDSLEYLESRVAWCGRGEGGGLVEVRVDLTRLHAEVPSLRTQLFSSFVLDIEIDLAMGIALTQHATQGEATMD